MNRRNFVKAAAVLPVSIMNSQVSFASPLGEIREDAPRAQSGIANDRFELTLRRVLEGDSPRFTEEFLLADVRPTAERRFTEFSGDLSGRYIGALATAARFYGVDAPGLDELVEKAIALQKPEGYFGAAFNFAKPTDAEMALLWGNGRLLVGLLEYYQWKPAQPVLAASRRLGDFLVRISPLMLSKETRNAFGAQHFAMSYICWTQQTEGLTMLYAVTKDERYRKLTEDIAAVIERRPGDHVHGYLSSLRGVLDLYALTNNESLLRQSETAWQEITASPDLLITGGVPEGWSPNNHRTEGCGEADWVRLNLAMWKATADAKYLAMAEKAIFNELAFNQYATGDFGHRAYTETGLPAAGAARAWWCCTLHGLRCFPDIQQNVFRLDGATLRYETPLTARIETEKLSASAESTLALNGSVKIKIERAGKERVRIAVRQPVWAESVSLSLNGSGAYTPPRPGYVSTEKPWETGDTIELKYQMKLRSEPAGANRESFWFGPWLLGASAEQNPAYFNEMTTQNKVTGEGRPEKSQAETVPARFSIPVAATAMPYKQAEYPDQPGTVHLRPIAEQTGLPTTSWEVRFLAGKQQV